jgi:hypothetical protein
VFERRKGRKKKTTRARLDPVEEAERAAQRAEDKLLRRKVSSTTRVSIQEHVAPTLRRWHRRKFIL